MCHVFAINIFNRTKTISSSPSSHLLLTPSSHGLLLDPSFFLIYFLLPEQGGALAYYNVVASVKQQSYLEHAFRTITNRTAPRCACVCVLYVCATKTKLCNFKAHLMFKLKTPTTRSIFKIIRKTEKEEFYSRAFKRTGDIHSFTAVTRTRPQWLQGEGTTAGASDSGWLGLCASALGRVFRPPPATLYTLRTHREQK